MDSSDRSEAEDEGDPDSRGPTSFDPRPWLKTHATTAVGLVVAVALLGLVLRLLLLGDRIAHWDEGRVGYWILYYAETGSFAYRRIIHGPFIQHVNSWLFPIIGANDFTMRLPVALISATLPLSAILFRKHLRKAETVALALFLAVNPVVLYYSRFMRSDLLVATFMFLALGMFVRFYDTRRWRYVYAASALMACGFASKENAILYVLTWLGAAGLLADQALYRPRGYASGYHLLTAKVHGTVEKIREGASPDRSSSGQAPDDAVAANGEGRVDDDLRSAGELAGRVLLNLAGVSVVFLAISLFFYAPREGGLAGLRYPPSTAADQVMFWQGITDPTLFPTLVEQTWNHVSEEFGTWFSQAGETGDRSLLDKFVEFTGRYLRVMGEKAAVLSILALFGFLYERYVRSTSRNLIMFSFYGGFVSVLGYPLGTDIFGAWIVVHALVPLAIPAAVGLGTLFYWGHEAFAAEDEVGTIAAAVLLLVLGSQVAMVATGSVYQNPQSDDNTLVQYAQPSDDPRAELNAIRRAASNDSRTSADVALFYGEEDNAYKDGSALVEKDPAEWNNSFYNYRPLCSRWFNTLPLPWYFAASDANVTCARDPTEFMKQIGSNPPAVVITVEGDSRVPRSTLEAVYTRETYSMRTSGTRMTFWVHESVDIDR